jgi:hypothetical protein
MQEKRYLPICTENSEFVERPEIILIAAHVSQNIDDIEKIARTIAEYVDERTQFNSKLEYSSEFSRIIGEKYFGSKGSISKRKMVSSFVMSAISIKSATNLRPSLNKSIKFAAYGMHQDSKTGSPEGEERAISRAHEKYRNILHIIIAASITGDLIKEIDDNKQALIHYLGIVRSVEYFIDSHMISPHFAWNPFRIPEHIPMIDLPAMHPLNSNERAAIGF